jgi:predicted GNAT family acetyltransferase
MAELRATPMSNPIMGLLADRLKKAQQFGAKPFGYENPPVEMLMNLLGVPAVQQTMERMAYGEPLTTGSGMTTKPRPEAIEAAMTLLPASVGLAKATKGLPVGASIEKVGKFDIVKRDASDIFGEGSQRIRYIDPKSNGQIEVLARKDGTASVLSLEVPEKFRGQKIGESLQKQVLQDFPDMQGQVSSKAAATTAYRLGRRPVDMPNATLKDVHKMIDEDSSVNMISPQMQERINPSASYPQKEALDTAQRNAALPVEEGGLGLPKDNTPEMRAEVMGFDLKNPQYHATNVPEDFTSIRPSARGKMGAGIYTSPEAKYAEKYGGNQDVRILPLVSKGEYADADTRENIFDIIRGELYQKNPNFTAQELNNAVSQEMQRKGFSGFDVDKERLTFSPDQMRSRFAAFDPFRATTETASTRGVAPPDLLAGVLPLGLLADEEQRKKLYELMPSLLGQ